MVPVSGEQYELEYGGYHATIASVGASLRELTFNSRHLVVPFAAEEVRPAFRGVVLAPWPNRVAKGQYTFNGVDEQLALTEPKRGHALHGLACWLNFTVVSRGPDRIALSAIIEPQVGYPHRIEVVVTYRLDSTGLSCTLDGVNIGGTTAPYAASTHPYLVAGPGRVDEWTFELPASSFLAVDDVLIPTHEVRAGDGEFDVFDFREARPIASTEIDHAFSDLTREENGDAVVRLTVADGSGVELSWDDTSPWVQVHTADLPDESRSRLGLAVEPMSCAPDAFNSGVDLDVLGPGENLEISWRIAAIV